MARKTTVKPKEIDASDKKEHKKTELELAETYSVVIDDKAKKLSPKSPGFISFQLAKHLETNELELRLVSVEGGGLHSKEWIKLSDILTILECQIPDKPFKSGVFKPAFKGASANNASFLAAVLRAEAINLIVSTENSIFLHQLSEDLESKREALLKLTSNK